MHTVARRCVSVSYKKVYIGSDTEQIKPPDQPSACYRKGGMVTHVVEHKLNCAPPCEADAQCVDHNQHRLQAVMRGIIRKHTSLVDITFTILYGSYFGNSPLFRITVDMALTKLYGICMQQDTCDAKLRHNNGSVGRKIEAV